MKHILCLLAAAITIASCKKEEVKSPPIASLTVVHAVLGGKTAKFGNFTGLIFLNDFTQLGLTVGEHNLYIWPNGDPLNPYFTYNKLSVQQAETYSLFLGGTPGAVDGILVKENIPYRTDSTAGIRFINLSPNSTPLNITLSTTPTVNEVSNLAYKDKTNFLSYPGLYNSAYTFQVRAANNPNTILTSISLAAASVPRFANITIVIRQTVAGGFSTFIVRNDRP